MKTSRLNRILDMLSKNGVSQMVITDPYTIYYLTDVLSSLVNVFLLFISVQKEITVSSSMIFSP